MDTSTSSPSSSSCADVPDSIVDSYDAPEFENTPAIEWMHESTPRFGHSNNLELLMTGNAEEQRDYMKGLIASSIAIICFFVVWVFALVLLKCLGRNQAGLLSGQPKPQPPQPASHNALEMESWVSSYEKAKKRMRFCRVLVFLAGIGLIASAMVMCISGVKTLTQSLDSGRYGIAMVQSLIKDGIVLIDSVINQNDETAHAIQNVLKEANGICPNVRPELCTDVHNISTCNFDGIFDTDVAGLGDQFSSTIEAFLDHFANANRSIYYREIIKARKDLDYFLDVTNNVDDKAQSVDWALIAATVFNALLAFLCFLIIIGLACRHRAKGMLYCLRHWLVVPIFSLLVALSFIFSLIFIVGSMAVADMCIDSPDERFLILLNRFQDKLGSPMVIELVSFYIHRCPPDLIPTEVAEQLQFVLDAAPAMADFTSIIKELSTSIKATCGFNNTDQLIHVAEMTNVQLCDIAEILKNIRLFFQCENWYPLYETIAYDSVCYSSTGGFAWIAVTQFLVVFFAMVMMTFRGVFHEIPIEKS